MMRCRRDGSLSMLVAAALVYKITYPYLSPCALPWHTSSLMVVDAFQWNVQRRVSQPYLYKIHRGHDINDPETQRGIVHVSNRRHIYTTVAATNAQDMEEKNGSNHLGDNGGGGKDAAPYPETDFTIFHQCLEDMRLPQPKQSEIMKDITDLMGFTSCSELYILSLDFVDRPEVLSSVLRNDFGLSVGKSHLIRGALMRLVSVMGSNGSGDGANENTRKKTQDGELSSSPTSSSIEINSNLISSSNVEKISASAGAPSTNNGTISNTADSSQNGEKTKKSTEQKKRPLFKSVVVNQKAKQRHIKANGNCNGNLNGSFTTKAKNNNNYGLPPNYRKLYPRLSRELDDFLEFMTKPSASYVAQESPIRKATATVYIRHAKLFMGWFINVYRLERGLNQFTMSGPHKGDGDGTRRDGNNGHDNGVESDVASISIEEMIPDKEAKSAQPIVDFILWLRHTRHISDSYEANMLRGLTKLLKYRFRDESKADPSYGEKSFGDIPVVRELRKLHRDANRRQILSPRSSEEDRKWLDWEEYLNVVRLLKEDVENEIRIFESKMTSKSTDNPSSSRNSGMNGDGDSSNPVYTPTHRRIATKFQAYLILAFFSCVPDRQRTFRELEVGRSFLRDESINSWTIKHGPDDYKTGKTYGDRPPLVLAAELTPAIDDFLDRWRPCLLPLGQSFFVQPRTGKAFTQDSVYSLVARSCYKHTGKKTNPHLLRDMIVTHVRDSDASEKELEALALYMGHSISMQRNSYDRRTMEQKVAPAVELLRNVNTFDKNNSSSNS